MQPKIQTAINAMISEKVILQYNKLVNLRKLNLGSMKKLLLLIALVSCSLTQAQTLTEVVSTYIQPTASTQELKTGLLKIEKICSTNPQEKCNKATAMALYLLADDYYQIALQVKQVDDQLTEPFINKASEFYSKAESLMTLDQFSDYQKQLLTEYKAKYEQL